MPEDIKIGVQQTKSIGKIEHGTKKQRILALYAESGEGVEIIAISLIAKQTRFQLVGDKLFIHLL